MTNFRSAPPLPVVIVKLFSSILVHVTQKDVSFPRSIFSLRTVDPGESSNTDMKMFIACHRLCGGSLGAGGA